MREMYDYERGGGKEIFFFSKCIVRASMLSLTFLPFTLSRVLSGMEEIVFLISIVGPISGSRIEFRALKRGKRGKTKTAHTRSG